MLLPNKLEMPLLVMGGDHANGPLIAKQAPVVAKDVTTVIIKDSGHWLVAEHPQETVEALLRFL